MPIPSLSAITSLPLPILLPILFLGIISILRLLTAFLNFLRTNLRSSSLHRYNHTNAYAVITGATDGIGLGFAHELLSNDFNVILHGRNENKLKRIQSDLRSQYSGKDVRYYIADASKTSSTAATEMDAMLTTFTDLAVTILVNNLGGMVGVEPMFVPLEENTAAQVEHIIALNSIYPTQMARALLPVLKENEPSLILNISSLAAVTPTPFLSIYNGAKAYLVQWSHSIAVEMRAVGRDVEVMLIEVGTSLTKGNPMSSKADWFTPTARQLAKATLQKVGCGQWKVAGYWPHALQKVGLLWMPERWVEGVVMFMAVKMRRDGVGEKRKED